jgi:hypothetical protein
MSALQMSDLFYVVNFARCVFPTGNAIVGGGAPRDLLNGAAVRDIDVFVLCDETPTDAENSDFAQRCKTLAALLGGQAAVRPAAEEYPGIFDLCDITCADLPTIQVVGLTCDPIDDVCNYDFDLSQFFATGAGVFGTEVAWKARAAKTITYTPSVGDTDASRLRSKARLGRLREKYQGWTFANCESLDLLVAPEPVNTGA